MGQFWRPSSRVNGHMPFAVSYFLLLEGEAGAPLWVMGTRPKGRVLGMEGRKLEGAQDLEDVTEQNYRLCLGLPLGGSMRTKCSSRLFNPLLFWIPITCSEL